MGQMEEPEQAYTVASPRRVVIQRLMEATAALLREEAELPAAVAAKGDSEEVVVVDPVGCRLEE